MRSSLTPALTTIAPLPEPSSPTWALVRLHRVCDELAWVVNTIDRGSIRNPLQLARHVRDLCLEGRVNARLASDRCGPDDPAAGEVTEARRRFRTLERRAEATVAEMIVCESEERHARLRCAERLSTSPPSPTAPPAKRAR